MSIVHVGIDLAKNVFAVHGVDQAGKPALVRPAVARAKPHELIASLPPCTVAMQACSGAHHWARLFAPKFVTPQRMRGARGKNDAADAAAIRAAVRRPSMRFVPVKSIDQQTRLMARRARQGYVEARTACINRVRGLFRELGVVPPLKAATARRAAGQARDDLPGWANTVVGDLLSELHRLVVAEPGWTCAGCACLTRGGDPPIVLGERMRPPRASFIRVRGTDSATSSAARMTGCRLSVRTLARPIDALRCFAVVP